MNNKLSVLSLSLCYQKQRGSEASEVTPHRLSDSLGGDS